MGLGRILTRTRPVPTENRNAGSNYQLVISDNPPYPFTTQAYQGAMSIPACWRAANLVADILGQLPWHAYRERAGMPVERLATPPLLEQPAPPEPRVTTFAAWGLDYLWHGNAIGIVASRNAEGWPTSALPVPADQVAVRLQNGVRKYAIGTSEFDYSDMLHIQGPTRPGDVRGFGVLEAHAETLKLGHTQRAQALSLGAHGVPTGILKSQNPDLTAPEAADLKAKWLASQSSRTVAVLNATTDFQPLSWNPEELELVEARKLTNSDIALMFGIPAFMLNVPVSSLTYSTVEQDSLNFLRYSMSGHFARFEAALTQQFPRGTWVKANFDAFLRAATKERYDAHAVALSNGFMTVNEVRALEDLPPLPEAPQPKQEVTPNGDGQATAQDGQEGA